MTKEQYLKLRREIKEGDYVTVRISAETSAEDRLERYKVVIKSEYIFYGEDKRGKRDCFRYTDVVGHEKVGGRR